MTFAYRVETNPFGGTDLRGHQQPDVAQRLSDDVSAWMRSEAAPYRFSQVEAVIKTHQVIVVGEIEAEQLGDPAAMPARMLDAVPAAVRAAGFPEAGALWWYRLDILADTLLGAYADEDEG